jgi:hypothetical protein
MDPRRFRLSVRAEDEATGTPLGETAFRVDLEAAFETVCGFLAEQARDDAKLHGASFIDSRGMRALLAGYERTGNAEYRAAALRWGDLMMELQREDGGYRMGYGITPKGEACYVADGGEIALGIARLVSYADDERRERLLRSLDAYMGYREAFRVPTGGIGVGWCLHDYGVRPPAPLETPTRIYAPEVNTYTIGCTLAAACAHARLRDDPGAEGRADDDADWLTPRLRGLSGAAAESYAWAHYLSRDPDRRKAYAAVMRERLIGRLPAPDAPRSWWLESGGRSALNLAILVYWLHEIEDTPAVRAEMLRALAAMGSPDSAESIPVLIERPPRTLTHDDWIYICYGSLSLAEALEPGVSMRGVIPAR